MERVFPAVFHEEDDRYWVEFPDIPGCFSQGETLEEAYRMAGEALALALDDNDVAEPCEMENFIVSGGDRVILVEAGSGEAIVHIQNSAG